MEKIILSTHNNGKIEEIKFYLKELDIEILPVSNIINIGNIEETSNTLEGNATIKAEYIRDKVNGYILSDDTGLFVEALNGKPGVYSARYAGENATDKDNRIKLLKALKNSNNRRAYFRTVLVLIDKNNKKYILDGICKGTISKEEKGINGFGYDSLFIPDGFSKTFAELDLEIKNKISHRSKALNKLQGLMVNILDENSNY